MSRTVKLLLIVLAVVVAVPLVVLAIGFTVPRTHTASSSVVVAAEREAVWALVSDFEGSSAWREGVVTVTRLPGEDREAYEERNDFGVIRYEVTERRAPSYLVTRIIDNDQFGGTWTYELEQADGGTHVTITEEGEIDSAFFRFMARFVFGYDATLTGYLASLEKAVSRGG